MKSKISSFLLMYFSFFIYSLSSIFSKIASMQDFMSLKYVFCFGAIIIILGLYAVLWQQVLKKVELSVAMANKPIVLILGTVWAVFFFNEEISIKFVVGMILILVGILIVSLEKIKSS